MFFTKEQFDEMSRLQNEMNSIVNPDWVTAKYPWYRAAYIEAVELMGDSYKWWKHSAIDIDNAKIEVVDIWHFVLSNAMIEKDRYADFARHMRDIEEVPFSDFVTNVEFFISSILRYKSVGPYQCEFLAKAMIHIGLSWDECYKLYILKNVLNRLRQKHGYKDGTYIKMWNGVEDNAVAMKIASDFVENLTYDSLFDKLDTYYTTNVKK